MRERGFGNLLGDFGPPWTESTEFGLGVDEGLITPIKNLPSRSLAPPLNKMVGEAARRRLETRRMVAHLQVIRSSLSRAPAEW